jgi:hypothetical protein
MKARVVDPNLDSIQRYLSRHEALEYREALADMRRKDFGKARNILIRDAAAFKVSEHRRERAKGQLLLEWLQSLKEDKK